MIGAVTGPLAAWKAAGTIAAAFADLPAARYLLPNPHDGQWTNVAQPYFTIAVEHAMTWGTVYADPDYTAVAVWFDATVEIPPPDDYEQARLNAVGEQLAERFARLDDALAAADVDGEPHHHLAFLAVRPHLQGQGRGTALIRHHHAVLDRLGIRGYLESASPALNAVYHRHGYTPAGDITVDGTPLFTQMWRPAATT